MKIEKIDIAVLVLDPANARKHGQKNLDAIRGSLARFGQQKPIVVNHANVVVAGNGTLEAAKSLGWKEISIVRTDLTGSDITAFGLADNRTSELAEWSDDVLGSILHALREEDFELTEIGFDTSYLDDLYKPQEFELEGDDEGKPAADEKFIVEITFPDKESMLEKYEALASEGLVVRCKNG